jgi:4-amino-4-deoxy-L-arabinose transferase-like glycosyltransferase
MSMILLRRTAPSLAFILLITALARLVALPGAREDNMTPDGARFLNLAREIRRGAGYVTPEACPAWMNPERLPTPETFKEPGYPYAIAALTPLTGNPFVAGQWVSLLAGLLLPLATYALMRALEPDRAAATIAGVFAAASPLLILQSVYVMADSLFALALTLAFTLAARRPTDPSPRRFDIAAMGAGGAFALAFLVRAQALIGLPALILILAARRAGRAKLIGLGVAAAAAGLVIFPFVLRNLKDFAAPFHSDVLSIGLLPYVDRVAFTHSLERPPPAPAWMLAHPREVLVHSLGGLREFLVHTLPGSLLGQRAWLVPLLVGVAVAWRARERWGFALLFGASLLVGLLPLMWLPRYFTPLAPFVAGMAALGVLAMMRLLASRVPATRHVPALVFVLLGVLMLVPQVERARVGASPTFAPEIAAARAYGPWLRARLAPGEAVMCETTSYWAWYSDRPAVYLPISDEARLRAVVRRLRVRWAALPLSRLPEFAARYPSGKLPELLAPVLEDAARDVAIFRIRPD